VQLPAPNPRVIFQKLDDGAVLFSPDTELYFGLNEVGALAWQQLPPAVATLDDLTAHVSARYPDAPIALIRADLEELLAALMKEGLAQAAGSRGADADVGKTP